MPSQSPPLEVSAASPAVPIGDAPAAGAAGRLGASAPSAAWRRAAWIAGGWAAVAALGVAAHGVLAWLGLLDPPAALDVARHLLGACAGALATPLVLDAARRWPVRYGGAGALLAHAALGTALILVAATLTHAVAAALFPGAPPLGAWIAATVQEGVAYYAALVALGTALGGEGAAPRPRPTEPEAEVLRAQLQALKAQVQPHFLFNTLHAIAQLVRDEPRGAERMVLHLGDLLRATLKAGDAPLVTLREEAAMARAYLGIQKIRYRGRLLVHVDLPDEMGNALVPALVLQPLVENAVRHGAEPRTETTTVEVAAEVDGGDLLLHVRDDGAGPGGRSRRGAGTSLRALSVRLLRLYGDGASLEHGARAGGGYRASVRIPHTLADGPSRYGR